MLVSEYFTHIVHYLSSVVFDVLSELNRFNERFTDPRLIKYNSVMIGVIQYLNRLEDRSE